MAYEENKNKLTKLKALEQLAERTNTNFATKSELTTLKNRIDEIVSTGGEPNKIDEVKVNGEAVEIKEKAVDIKIPTKVGDLINDKDYQDASDVSSAIDAKLSAVYKPGGSYGFDSLPEPSADTLGKVYNVTDEFTTTTDFLEGDGNTCPAGTNVVVIDAGSEDYKYDVLAGFVDLSDYQTKETGKGLSTEDFTTELKEKLNGLTYYKHPDSDAGEKTIALYKIATDKQGHVIKATEVVKTDITNLGIPEKDTTYEPATDSVSGLMSNLDKQKLNSIEIATDEDVKEMLDNLFGVED